MLQIYYIKYQPLNVMRQLEGMGRLRQKKLIIVILEYNLYVILPFHIVKGIYRCKRMIFGNRRMFIPFENDSYIATFIIPKGAVYTINSCGEIVSNKIMYTGRYLKL